MNTTTLILELTPQEAQKVERARAQGVDIDAIVRQLLDNLPEPPLTLTPQERAQAFLEWAESHRNYSEPQVSQEKSPRPLSLQDTLSPEEWVQALREWAEGHDPNLPVLTEEAMSRESIYGERGL